MFPAELPARKIIIRADLYDVRNPYADSGTNQQLRVAFRLEGGGDLAYDELAAIHEAATGVYQTSNTLGGLCDWRTPSLVHFGISSAGCLQVVPLAILTRLEQLIAVAGLGFTAGLEGAALAA